MGGGPALLDAPEVAPAPAEERPSTPAPYRRLVIAVVVGLALVAVPYLYVLWDLWTGHVTGLRASFPANFYEDQARALAHGHLWIPYSQLGVEAFFNGGHAYTYFGLFPSLLRIPFMAVDAHLGGQMTASSLLVAWVLTGVLSSLLLWRTRVMLRGAVVMGWAEAVSMGALVAAITGGSVLIYLAANPWVYDEDLAWSVALTTGALFCLLGVLERPSLKRILWAGGFILCADLNRLTTGWACVIGALLVAGWFAFGKDREENRRWVGWVAAAGLVPLFIGCTVNTLKFGSPFALPMANQEWTQINAHRRLFLAANGGKGYSLKFLPSTLVAYFQPSGIHFTSAFPFITLPTYPAKAVGSHVVLDQTYATGSIDVFMPLLFLSGLWGLVTAFRPKALRGARLFCPLLLAAAAATAGVMLWGYIADRYVSDLMPLLIVASILGMVDLWRRLDGKSRLVRSGFTAVVTLLAVYSVAANTGASLASFNAWNSPQAVHYVSEQKALTPGATAAEVRRGSSLPYWAPANTLFNVDNCSAFYLSTGISFANSPGQQDQHETWVPLEQGKGTNTSFTVELNEWPGQLKHPLPLLRYGRTTIVLEAVNHGHARFRMENPGPAPSWPVPVTGLFYMKPHNTYRYAIMTDRYMHVVEISELKAGQVGTGQQVGLLFNHYLIGDGPARLLVTPASRRSRPVVSRISAPAPDMSLCRSL